MQCNDRYSIGRPNSNLGGFQTWAFVVCIDRKLSGKIRSWRRTSYLVEAGKVIIGLKVCNGLTQALPNSNILRDELSNCK